MTGAGKKSGIGYAIARKLAAGGANVILADLIGRQTRQDTPAGVGMDQISALAADMARTFKVKAVALELDVTAGESVARLAEKVQRQFGHIHILCNNAGAVFGVPNAIHTYDESAWLKTIDVNLHGVFRVSRALVPLMTEGGCIVNVASRAAKVPPLFNGAYAVAKAGVVMLTRVMAKELAGAGIRVNTICPGVTQTDFTDWRYELEADILDTTVVVRQAEMLKMIPMGRLGTPEEVADLVVFLASGQSAYITGQAINITDGELLVRCLHAEGIRFIHAITDGTYMMVIEALERLGDELGIQLIVPRHEAAAAHACDAYSRCSGDPAVVMARAGPGDML